MLQDSTPKDSGDMSKSWRELTRGIKYVVIGTDLEEQFLALVNGQKPMKRVRTKSGKKWHFFIGDKEFFRVEINRPYVKGQDFMTPIVNHLDAMMETLIYELIKKHWKWFDNIQTSGIPLINLSKTVGLGTTNFNKRRGRGGGFARRKTGRKTFSRRLGRRRRTGTFITSKSVSVG